jgi:ELWxxDGT repeat protein
MRILMPLCLILSILLTNLAFAAAPEIIKDINTNDEDIPVSSLMSVNGKAVSLFKTPDYGQELGVIDPTGTPITLLSDLTSGPESSWIYYYVLTGSKLIGILDNRLAVTDASVSGTSVYGSFSSVQSIVRLGDTAFLSASNDNTTAGLFKTDGTEGGTSLVKDFAADEEGSWLDNIFVGGNHLFVPVYSGNNSIWRSDGSTDGTVKIKDLPELLDQVNIAAVGSSGRALLVSESDDGETLEAFDGTSWTTILSDASSLSYSIVAGTDSVTAYVIDRSTTPLTVYITDGSAAGTSSVLAPAEIVFWNSDRAAVSPAGDLYFWSGAKIWRISSAGTLTELLPSGTSLSSVGTVRFAGANVVVAAGTADGHNLYRVSGANLVSIKPSGTSLVSSSSTLCSQNSGKTVIFFFGQSGDIYGLYRSDGTVDGTVLVKAFPSSPAESPVEFAGNGEDVADHFFFSTSTPQAAQTYAWISDGTEAGTKKLDVSIPGVNAASIPQDDASLMTASQGKVFFVAYPNGSPSLWVSDGTLAGTSAVPVSTPLSNLEIFNPEDVSSTGGTPTVAFTGYYDDGSAHHGIYLATESSISQLVDVSSFGEDFYPETLTRLSSGGVDRVIAGAASPCDFYAYDILSGAGGKISEDAMSNCPYTNLSVLKSAGLAFKRFWDESSESYKIFRTDGTSAGSTVISDPFGQFWDFDGPYTANPPDGASCLFAIGRSQADESTLLKTSDLSTVVTMVPATIMWLTALGVDQAGIAYFSWTDSINRQIRFYKASCTDSGLNTIGTIPYPEGSYMDTDLLATGVWISIYDSSDATKGYMASATGVQQLITSNIYLGATKSTAGIGNFSIFQLNSLSGLSQIWQTDGSIDGTLQLGTVGHGYESAMALTSTGSQVLFEGNDVTHGKEPWIVTADQCPTDSNKTTPGTCGCGVADADIDLNGVMDCISPPLQEIVPSKAVFRTVKKKNKKTYQLRFPTTGAAYKISFKDSKNKKAKAKIYKTTKNPYTISSKVKKGLYQVTYQVCNRAYSICSKVSAKAKVKKP